MTMQHPLRRLAMGAVLAGAAFAAAPAIASASSTCTFDTASHQVIVQDGSGSGQLVLSRSGEHLTYADDWGAPQLCVKACAAPSRSTTSSWPDPDGLKSSSISDLPVAPE